MPVAELTWDQRVYYRDKLRAARYAALADAEGFVEICFAIEAIGLHLHGKEESLGRYRGSVRRQWMHTPVLPSLSRQWPALFSTFDALYETLRLARNDAMHCGAYARHATTAAIELCVGLEEALMEHDKPTRRTVRDFMVKSPITVEHWQPVAQARQLMLTHSFSFLPIKLEEKWRLVSELALAKYLHQKANRRGLLATSLADAAESASGTGLELVDAVIVNLDTSVADLLKSSIAQDRANLWLITDDGHRLVGVLSPFELM